MSGNNEDWKSHAFRHKVMMNINEALKKSGSPNNPQEIEQLIFQKANSRDNYMTMLARIILAFSSGHNKSQLTQPVNTGAMMDASVQPTALMNPEALKADNNTQILSKILTQPSPLSNLSAPSPQFYQTLSPATVQPGKPTKTSQARTPQVSQQTVGYPSPSPVIPSPSPVGHSPAPASSPQLVQSPSSAVATRVSGIPSVESPGSFNPPSISNPGSQESPVKLSDKEEQLYVEKSTAPIGQSFLQALNAKADSPQSNNTLYRMFGPTLATIYGPPMYVGYGYIGDTLERLNIEPGKFCAKYVASMDSKSTTAKLRKAKKEVKYRRNQLHREKNSKLTRSKKREGKTYESNIGLNLQVTNETNFDPLEITESTTDEQHQRYEKLIPEFCQNPPEQPIIYDAARNYKFIMFDTETTTTGRKAEICQLSAVDEGQNEFNCYVLPEGNINEHASDVNKLQVSTVNGQRILCHNGEPVEATSKNEALSLFVSYITRCGSNEDTKNNIPVLIGHNSLAFDVPILLRSSTPEFTQALKKLKVHFGDSLILAKQILKEEHPALRLSASEFCRAALGSLYSTLFGQSFEAHDALEDVKALRRVLFQSKLALTEETIVSKSKIISCESALAQVQYHDDCHVRLQTFAGNLYDPVKDKGIITKAMANKIAESGITYQDLVHLFRQAGREGIIAILSLPPSSTARSTKPRPRVTRNRRILSAVCSFFTRSV